MAEMYTNQFEMDDNFKNSRRLAKESTKKTRIMAIIIVVLALTNIAFLAYIVLKGNYNQMENQFQIIVEKLNRTETRNGDHNGARPEKHTTETATLSILKSTSETITSMEPCGVERKCSYDLLFTKIQYSKDTYTATSTISNFTISYGNNKRYYYVISATVGKRIEYWTNNFETEQGHDFLLVVDGCSLESFTGRDNRLIYRKQSNSSVVSLFFLTDYSNVYQDHIIFYHAV